MFKNYGPPLAGINFYMVILRKCFRFCNPSNIPAPHTQPTDGRSWIEVRHVSRVLRIRLCTSNKKTETGECHQTSYINVTENEQ